MTSSAQAKWPVIHNTWLCCSNLIAMLVIMFAGSAIVSAQSVCLPLPRLLTMMPMGGSVGSQVEIAITGEHLDEVKELFELVV